VETDQRRKLVAYVLTRDEEAHIVNVVHSLRQVTDSVVVIDSGSADSTQNLARRAGAEVWERPFEGFSAQRNWAIERIIATYDPAWILALDADERLSTTLAAEIQRVTHQADSTRDVYLFRLKIRFAGRALRFGGLARTLLPRLYRPGAGRYEQRSVNEHFAPYPGARLAILGGWLLHEDVASWERHIAKHNLYSTLEAQARLERSRSGHGISLREAFRRPYLRRRFLRERLWNHLPAKSLLRFLQIYVLSGGFLDGSAGYKVALFQAWQEMCTDLKYGELLRDRS